MPTGPLGKVLLRLTALERGESNVFFKVWWQGLAFGAFTTLFLLIMMYYMAVRMWKLEEREEKGAPEAHGHH